eukprot:3445823-Rhodomonas_salina.2
MANLALCYHSQVISATCLRAPYAMSGTDSAYLPKHALVLNGCSYMRTSVPAYAPALVPACASATGCAVLRARMVEGQ